MLQVDRRLITDIRKSITDMLGAVTTKERKAVAGEAAGPATKAIAAATDQLRESLHTAMKLEASTIPPYLVAAWSIQDSPSPGFQNTEIRQLILSIAKEEMLHMMGVANIIAAMGEPPNIANKDIVLNWGKDKLPIGGDLVPQLAPFSMDQLSKSFMKIEEPKDPQHYVVLETVTREASLFATIGEFYEAIITLINSFPEDPFANGAAFPQIRIPLDPRIGQIGHEPITDFAVKNKTEAINILHWIVDQGEGSTEGPLDGNGEPAHYYRFAEIYKGGKLIKDATQPLGYAYDRAGQPINCDFTAVRQFAPNPKMKDFDPNSRQFKGLLKFNEAYTSMFKELQQFYDGNDPQQVPNSINSMNTMTSFVNPLFNSNPSVCPSFEWIDATP